MAALGLLFVIAALIVVGIGIVVGIVATLACAVMIALGIISSSAAVAFVKRSPSAGLMSFLLQVCGAVGALGGIAAGLFGAALLEIEVARAWVVLSGATGGALAGTAVGWLLHFCITRGIRWLHANLEIGTPR